jgi:hypothetical protein
MSLVSLFIRSRNVIETKEVDFSYKRFVGNMRKILIFPSPPLLGADQVSRVLW